MRRELIATSAGREIEILVERRNEGRFRVIIDGRERAVDARQVRPGTWSLLVDGRSWLVDLDERRQGTVLLVGETETPIVLEDARRKRLARTARREDAGACGGEEIVAPIAGKVVKLLVGEGEEVAPGQGACVLEAMKMENEIKADQGGAVKKVHVQPGQSVETGEKLLTLG